MNRKGKWQLILLGMLLFAISQVCYCGGGGGGGSSTSIPSLVSISVTPANAIPMGMTKQFTASGSYSDGTSQDLTTQVAWSSANTSVATVNSSGLAMAVGAGTTTITATSSNVSGNTTLTVTSATLSSISITPTNPSVPLGLIRQFTASGTYSDGASYDITAQVTWTSSNTSVATVNSSGLATAVGVGTTTITAASGNVSGNTTLTVTPAGKISLAWTPPTINADGSPLTDLAGYLIYYGAASGTYDHIIDVGNVPTYTLIGLTLGQTYYIAITAYDTSNNLSVFSNEVSGISQ